MSKISQCPKCGGNIVEPAYEGDGAYPVGRMCECHANGWRNDDATGRRTPRYLNTSTGDSDAS